ncbi:MAG: hypothetical protein LQ352_003927 [Teloschistes flavicans]|nr:MAG: hypothetical protein LQ352_003927 [Teloschistes flavicans]
MTTGSPRNVDPSSAISRFALLLSTLSIKGPLDLYQIHSHLGTGAQFIVHQQEILSLNALTDTITVPQNRIDIVAIKKPRFSLEDTQKRDLTNPVHSRQVRHMVLEITALCHPDIRDHPNIVNLLAWGYDTSERGDHPFLALELANCNLANFATDWDSCPVEWRHRIGLDVGCGLDAVHGIQLIHGDLKPENVLMFFIHGNWIAKLADFGGGIDVDSGGRLQGRGSFGWRAPELWEDSDIKDEVLSRIDSYSYGLLLWSLFLREDCAIPCNESIEADQLVLSELTNKQQNFDALFWSALKKALPLLLRDDPNDRPKRLDRLLQDGGEVHQDWLWFRDLGGGGAPQWRVSEALTAAIERRYDWEIPEISQENATRLWSLFLENNALDTRLIYGMFLNAAGDRPLVHNVKHRLGIMHQDISKRDLLLALLRAGAQEGCEPMRALIFDVYEHLHVPMPYDIADTRQRWTSEAIAGGAFFMRTQLRDLDIESFNASVKRFQERGGYNKFYCDFNSDAASDILDQMSSEDIADINRENVFNARGDLLLHILASIPLCRLSSKIIESTEPQEIDTLNNAGESALYRACMGGHTATVLSLLSRGADPSILPSKTGPSCLHWLFHFDVGDITPVAKRLVEQGADVCAISNQRIPLPHYPFTLPEGTPLHWALHMSVPEAVRALLALGANPSLRDGSDPYIFDRNVRHLDMLLHPHNMHCSTASSPTIGLSAIDLAVRHRDHAMLMTMLASAPFDPDDADEEGHTAVHRLDAGQWIYTIQGSKIWTPLFSGTLESQALALRKTLDVLVRYGFSLNNLTKRNPAYKSDSISAPRTALMLAVRQKAIPSIEALLSAGANVNIVNDMGDTALASLTANTIADDDITEVTVMKKLLDAKADIHARDNRGHTALLRAGDSLKCVAVETLLNYGADIRDRGPIPDDLNIIGRPTGWTTLAYVATCPPQDVPTRDDWLLSQLKRHAFPFIDQYPTGTVLRREVLENVDHEDGSLLHHTAEYGLLRCCKALLKVGIDHNSLLRRVRITRALKFVCYRTPLDEVLRTKHGNLRKYQIREFSEQEVDQQMTVFDDVAKLLKDAGGLLGNDLRAQEVYHIESGKLLLQYWVSSDPAIKGRIVKNRAF